MLSHWVCDPLFFERANDGRIQVLRLENQHHFAHAPIYLLIGEIGRFGYLHIQNSNFLRCDRPGMKRRCKNCWKTFPSKIFTEFSGWILSSHKVRSVEWSTTHSTHRSCACGKRRESLERNKGVCIKVIITSVCNCSENTKFCCSKLIRWQEHLAQGWEFCVTPLFRFQTNFQELARCFLNSSYNIASLAPWLPSCHSVSKFAARIALLLIFCFWSDRCIFCWFLPKAICFHLSTLPQANCTIFWTEEISVQHCTSYSLTRSQTLLHQAQSAHNALDRDVLCEPLINFNLGRRKLLTQLFACIEVIHSGPKVWWATNNKGCCIRRKWCWIQLNRQWKRFDHFIPMNGNTYLWMTNLLWNIPKCQFFARRSRKVLAIQWDFNACNWGFHFNASTQNSDTRWIRGWDWISFWTRRSQILKTESCPPLKMMLLSFVHSATFTGCVWPSRTRGSFWNKKQFKLYDVPASGFAKS